MDLLADFNAAQIAFAFIAAFGAAFVRGLTGFGMAILLVPVLALALSPVEAVLVVNGMSVLIGLSEIRRLVRGAEASAWWISAACIALTPLGLLALAATGSDLARLIIALIALSAFIAILLPHRGEGKPKAITTAGVGAISGLMTGYAGMPGPPVVPYYVGREMKRETAMASMLLIFTIAGAAGVVSGMAAGLLSWSHTTLSVLLFPATLIGNAVGAKASGKISDPVWRTCVAAVLGGAALAALVRLF